MKLHTINTGFFKLDGGAMHGVVPKSIWNKFNPADENNLCTWAMRCLLIEDGDKLILIDNGIGDKQDFNFFRHYYLHGEDSLEKSLKQKGFSPEDITDVFLTHLHFDHCGGSVKRNGEKLELSFPNATYWSNEGHWNWALHPNKREGASFLRENILPIQESGHLKFVDSEKKNFITGLEIRYADGHTEKQMIPIIQYKNKNIAFVADLIPSLGHIPIPYVMSYDVRPLVSMEEKEMFLKEAADKNFVLFLEHDPKVECCTVTSTERGVRQDETFNLEELG